MSIPNWARIGAKVVHKLYEPLVTGKKRVAGAAYPVEGGIYTIREIVFASDDGAALILLREIHNSPPVWSSLEPGFNLAHFRPVVPLEDDIATHFRQHLDVREPVEA